MKKVTDTVRKLLLALILALALLNVTSCDMLGGDSPTLPTSPTNPTGPTNPTNPTTPNIPTSYHDFPNFNPADYTILSESGKPDSAIAELKDLIWLMYAEREDVGEWTANYIKSNKIKTILSDGEYGFGWIDSDQLDRLYLSSGSFHDWLRFYEGADDVNKVRLRKEYFTTFTHETMHLVQYKNSNYRELMTGMRPDICAALGMLTEFLPWFYANGRNSDRDITVDMKDAVETQSKYMVLATDALAYDDPWEHFGYDNYPFHSTWPLELYTQLEITSTIGIATTPPLIKASKEDILKIARALLACRDPKMAGVTDEALWTAFDALRKVTTGENKYIRLTDDYVYGLGFVSRESFNYFQEAIAEWDAEYAKQEQARSVMSSVSMELAAAIVW